MCRLRSSNVAAILLVGLVLLAAALKGSATPPARAEADSSFVPVGQGDGPSIDAAVSDDGRYVAFASEATNLVEDDRNGLQDIFVHDMETGETVRVSVRSDGEEADGYSELPVISADGRFVAFQSTASNLVPNDSNQVTDVFVHDLQTGETTRVSVSSDGEQAFDGSYEPALSADGRLVAFSSDADNLVANDANPGSDIFVHDRQTGATTLVSVSSAGKQSVGNAIAPSLSADGRTVAFISTATGLVPNDTNEYEDVFVRDRQTGKTTRVSVGPGGEESDGIITSATISASGRYVVFASDATTLVPGGGSRQSVYLHDRQTGQTSRVSVTPDGDPANGSSDRPRVSSDGRFVVFDSEASDLVASDANFAPDVFLRDRQAGTTALLSRSGTSAGNGESVRPAISAGGRWVAFHSRASDLVADDDNGTTDVFLRDRQTGETRLVSLATVSVPPRPSLLYLPMVRK